MKKEWGPRLRKLTDTQHETRKQEISQTTETGRATETRAYKQPRVTQTYEAAPTAFTAPYEHEKQRTRVVNAPFRTASPTTTWATLPRCARACCVSGGAWRRSVAGWWWGWSGRRRREAPGAAGLATRKHGSRRQGEGYTRGRVGGSARYRFTMENVWKTIVLFWHFFITILTGYSKEITAK